MAVAEVVVLADLVVEEVQEEMEEEAHIEVAVQEEMVEVAQEDQVEVKVVLHVKAVLKKADLKIEEDVIKKSNLI